MLPELYNAAREERQAAGQQCGVRVTVAGHSAQLPAGKEVRPEYRDLHSQVLPDVIVRVERAFPAFFRRVQAGEKPGYPRCQGVNRDPSFTYKQFGNGATLDTGFLVLSQLGRITVRWSRPVAGTIKTVTLSQEADGWYACCSCAAVPVASLEPTGQETGIDRGLEALATLADGTMSHHPRCYRKAEASLRRCQPLAARRKQGRHRRKQGRHRRKQAVELLAKAPQTIRRQRRDFHHKTARALVRGHDAISHEDVQPANMVRNHPLAKSISDAGWAQFLTILSFKAAGAGRSVVAVPPAFTRQACSGCGVLGKKGVSVRWQSCPDCGASLHRDHNAALNIRALGKKQRGEGHSPQALTQADGSYVA